MAWSSPPVWTGNTVLTAAQLNTYLRDNMLETMPAKTTQDGTFFVGNGSNSIVERTFTYDRVTTQETTTSTSYTDLSTTGPSITVTHGTQAIVFISAFLRGSGADTGAHMSWAMSGSNTRSALDTTAIKQDGVAAQQGWRIGGFDFLTGLNAGTTTFTAKYRVIAGTGTYNSRFISVVPL